jgi:hypothetical protein
MGTRKLTRKSSRSKFEVNSSKRKIKGGGVYSSLKNRFMTSTIPTPDAIKNSIDFHGDNNDLNDIQQAVFILVQKLKDDIDLVFKKNQNNKISKTNPNFDTNPNDEYEPDNEYESDDEYKPYEINVNNPLKVETGQDTLLTR